MFHLSDRLLAKLIDGSATTSDLQRIRRHVDECRACARRLEEWRDNFTEVDERFPELAVDAGPLATVTPGGLVMLPGSEPSRRVLPDLTTLLWIGAVLMALLVGYGASRLRQPSEGMRVATMDEVRGQPRSQSPAPSTPPRPADHPATTSTTTAKPVPDHVSSSPALTNDPPAGSSPGAAAQHPAAVSPPAPVANRPAPSPQPRTAPPPVPLTVSPNFREVSRPEAARRLGGPLRSMEGMGLDHIEVGPASAVPGAQSGLEVIRMVYRTPDGGRLLLDQQRIPADSDGLRSIDDPTLENGETAYGTGPGGVSVASWLDEGGYRISLVARARLDSLKKLVALVQ